jgi:hypothetical protein
MGKALTVGGHSVRMGYYLMRTDDLPCNTGEPVRFYQGQVLRRLWRVVDRFNRIQGQR